VETPVDSLFQIGSVIELLTATLEMQLVDDGLVDLDDPALSTCRARGSAKAAPSATS